MSYHRDLTIWQSGSTYCLILLPLQIPRDDPRMHGWHRVGDLRDSERPRKHLFLQREATLQYRVTLSFPGPSPPGSLCANVHVCQVNSAALPSFSLPHSSLPLFCLPPPEAHRRAAAAAAAAALLSLPPSLPPDS